ncbi:HAD family hydrolase [Lacticaseibacillus hulanensis]|uniref:HAD family hydrolase n=1 Tax=Lacticaseibacillus hulanensis TaxID=2493111 RepID=UPI000FDB1CBF|nr:HAD family hydrolase [Lacticaseibacillus hulanensis]
MNKIKLIATDMDHTLLTEAGELPPDFDRYLTMMAKADIQFVVASGRPLYTLETMFPQHKDSLILVCDNGAVIKDHRRIVSKTLLPNEDILAMCQFVQSETDGHALICGLDGAVAATADEVYDDEYRAFYTKMGYMDDLTTWSGQADKLTLYLPNHDAEQVFNDQINPQFGAKYSAAVTADCWIDIVPKYVNKGEALRKISTMMDVQPDEMMAFGDTFNDKEMLQYVKYGYLVANAHPQMKQYTNLHTSSNQEYGVLKIIKQVLARQSA